MFGSRPFPIVSGVGVRKWAGPSCCGLFAAGTVTTAAAVRRTADVVVSVVGVVGVVVVVSVVKKKKKFN